MLGRHAAARRQFAGWVRISRSIALISGDDMQKRSEDKQCRTQTPVKLAHMRQADRLSSVLERLSGNGSVGVGDLAGELGVSPATVRRDLRLLEDQHLLTRTHGGAVAQGVLYELPLRYRSAPASASRSAGSPARRRRGSARAPRWA